MMIAKTCYFLGIVAVTLAADVCLTPGGFGPCVMGGCPDAATMTCINLGTNDEICCSNDEINPTTPAAPTTAPNNPTTRAATSAPCVDQTDCSKLTYLCTDSLYKKLMSEQCGKTCGTCGGVTSAPPTGCVDKLNPQTGRSDCPNRTNLCNDPIYFDLMTTQCPKTCNRCSGTGTGTVKPPTTSCVDKINPKTGKSDCPGSAYLCNQSNYMQLMTEQCPKTCGRCSG